LPELHCPTDATLLKISGAEIGPGRPPFVIAEIGVNHNGDPELARRLIDEAARCGADAVKFQTFSSARLVVPGARKAAYQERDDSQSQSDMLARLELSADEHEQLQAYARSLGLQFLSTPFDAESADMLERLDVPAFKVSSGDLTHLSYLRYLARKGRPMLISTGMASLGDVEAAVDAIESTGNRQILIFHCVSNYPADPGDANLRAISTLAGAFGHPVGWSDHTIDEAVGFAAVAIGACALEKHLTLDRSLPGPDHAASADPAMFKRYVEGVRLVSGALGDGRKAARAAEEDIATVAKRSLFAARSIAKGERFNEESVTALRPSGEIGAARLDWVIGRTAQRSIEAGEALSYEMIGG
jgi:N,N'-diacetyllegionaminate synthase